LVDRIGWGSHGRFGGVTLADVVIHDVRSGLVGDVRDVCSGLGGDDVRWGFFRSGVDSGECCRGIIAIGADGVFIVFSVVRIWGGDRCDVVVVDVVLTVWRGGGCGGGFGGGGGGTRVSLLTCSSVMVSPEDKLEGLIFGQFFSRF
jgi:hypothetical protein